MPVQVEEEYTDEEARYWVGKTAAHSYLEYEVDEPCSATHDVLSGVLLTGVPEHVGLLNDCCTGEPEAHVTAIELDETVWHPAVGL